MRLRRRRSAQPTLPFDAAWAVPARFNFVRDVVERFAADPLLPALTHVDEEGIVDRRTFAELARDAARWSHLLRGRLAVGDRVVVVADHVPAWHALLLGALKGGVVASPATGSIDVDELCRRVRLLQASLVVADRASEEAVEQMLARGPAPPVLYLDDAVDELRRHHGQAPTEDTGALDPALVLFGPGPDALPVVHHHASTWATATIGEHWLAAEGGDLVWIAAPTDSPELVFGGALAAWSRGAEVLAHALSFEPEERIGLVQRLGVTILGQSADEHAQVAQVLPELPAMALPLRRALSFDGPLEPAVADVLAEELGLEVAEALGLAELPLVAAGLAGAPVARGSLGVPLPGHDLALLDAGGGLAPTGVEGEIGVLATPPTLFLEYLGQPEATAAAFRDGWFLTGVRAVRDEEGTLWAAGSARARAEVSAADDAARAALVAAAAERARAMERSERERRAREDRERREAELRAEEERARQEQEARELAERQEREAREAAERAEAERLRLEREEREAAARAEDEQRRRDQEARELAERQEREAREQAEREAHEAAERAEVEQRRREEERVAAERRQREEREAVERAEEERRLHAEREKARRAAAEAAAAAATAAASTPQEGGWLPADEAAQRRAELADAERRAREEQAAHEAELQRAREEREAQERRAQEERDEAERHAQAEREAAERRAQEERQAAERRALEAREAAEAARRSQEERERHEQAERELARQREQEAREAAKRAEEERARAELEAREAAKRAAEERKRHEQAERELAKQREREAREAAKRAEEQRKRIEREEREAARRAQEERRRLEREAARRAEQERRLAERRGRQPSVPEPGDDVDDSPIEGFAERLKHYGASAGRTTPAEPDTSPPVEHAEDEQVRGT